MEHSLVRKVKSQFLAFAWLIPASLFGWFRSGKNHELDPQDRSDLAKIPHTNRVESLFLRVWGASIKEKRRDASLFLSEFNHLFVYYGRLDLNLILD